MQYALNKVYPWIKAYAVENGVFGVMTYAKNGKRGEFTPIGENIPWHPYADTLGVFYVHDNGDIFEIVRNDMLPDGMTENELYETACQNLLRDVEFQIQQANYGGWGVLCGGNFEASSILLLNVMNAIGEQYGGDFYFAVPARDMMITAAENDKKQIKELKKAIKNITKNGEFPLSTAIFKWEYKAAQ